jgi:hypothetical protein
VDEDDRRGEVTVVFDDVLEVGKGLAAFVHGGVSRRVYVVDDVDEIPPAS